MKNIVFLIIFIALILLVGTWPLTILSKIFNWVSTAFEWLAKTLDVFNWNGLL